MLRRSLVACGWVTSFPRASITNARFMPRATAKLLEATEAKQFKSKYWLTAAQARRSCNTNVRVGEKATRICLEAEEVYPIAQLQRDAATRILEVNPPYFGNGVGILGNKGKWNLVLAKRLVSVLATGTEQDLWIDKDYVEAHNVALKSTARPLNISEQSSVLMFNADQLQHPHRGEPQEGVAINVMTGKRMPQPAHDILLAHGILKGYESCFWLPRKQLEQYRVTARQADAVIAPTAAGRLVPFHQLPQAFQSKVNKTMAFPSLFENHDLFYTLNAAGWERTRSSLVTSALTDAGLKSEDKQWKAAHKRFFWVNIDELHTYCDTQGEIDALHKFVADEGAHRMPVVDLTKVSEREFFNAAVTSEPSRCCTRVRSLHVFRGNPVGKKYSQILREEYVTRQYCNPIWVNRSEAKRIGVEIAADEVRNFVALEAPDKATGDLVHLHDIVGYEEILKKTPPPANATAPYLLLVQWLPILGKKKQEKLKKLSREGVNLWVTVSEILMADLAVKPGAQTISFNKTSSSAPLSSPPATGGEFDADDDDDDDGEERGLVAMSREAYNAVQTTDVVRVIGKSRYFVRPQGGLSVS